MPISKDAFDEIHPCDFYEPADILDSELMYTVAEIGRLLQHLEPDADIEPAVESVLLDWAVPWVIHHADALVVGDPLEYEGPGYYGLREQSA